MYLHIHCNAHSSSAEISPSSSRQRVTGRASSRTPRSSTAMDGEGEGSLETIIAFNSDPSPLIIRSALGGLSHRIDLTADDDEHIAGPSRPRLPAFRPNGLKSPRMPDRLFHEGDLNPDAPSSIYGPNGSVHSEALDEPELQQASETEDSPENSISPISHPISVSHLWKPSRPDVRMGSLHMREYAWMRKTRSPGSTSSRSSRSSRKSTSKYHSTPMKSNLRSPESRRQQKDWAIRQTEAKLDKIASQPGRVGQAGQRVKNLFRSRLLVPGRREERRFHRRPWMSTLSAKILT